MNKHFYVVYKKYLPNSAVSNRMLSYLKAWSQTDAEVTLVFMLPDRNFSRLQILYSNIKILYLWDSIPFRIYMLHFLFYYINIIRFLEILKDEDLVYEYGDPYLLSKLSKRKRIKIFHERTEHPQAYALGQWPYTITLNQYLDCCKAINGLFVISTPLKDYFSSVGVDNEKIYVVNMTVDASRFENVHKQKVDSPYIAYCGKATNNKDGVDQLIKAFSIISQRYPNIYLYIIGKAPQKSVDEGNYALVKKLNIEDKVIFKGVVPYTEMPQMLVNATILALDRPYNIQAQYGFPTKLGEYLLTGNPVVVTNVGDIHRFLHDGQSAMIAEPDAPSDFASKVIWLLNNSLKAELIGRAGKSVALANFNCEVEGKKVLDVVFSPKD